MPAVDAGERLLERDEGTIPRDALEVDDREASIGSARCTPRRLRNESTRIL
jgi:hypothetical protein